MHSPNFEQVSSPLVFSLILSNRLSTAVQSPSVGPMNIFSPFKDAAAVDFDMWLVDNDFKRFNSSQTKAIRFRRSCTMSSWRFSWSHVLIRGVIHRHNLVLRWGWSAHLTAVRYYYIVDASPLVFVGVIVRYVKAYPSLHRRTQPENFRFFLRKKLKRYINLFVNHNSMI